jgi:Ca2+-binding EF-hand superfamily protein
MIEMQPKHARIPRMRVVLGLLLIGIASGGNLNAERPSREGEQHKHRRHEGGFSAMLKKLDLNGDHSVDFTEFSAGERVSHLPDDYKKKLFQRLDKNKDNQITKADQPSQDEGARKRRHSDADGNGEITFEEFKKSDRVAKMPLARKREIFDKMDRNKDGVLNGADWKGRRERGRGPWHAVENLDANKDGKISLEEFRKHPRHADTSEERQTKQFQNLDKNKDGFLEKSERPMGPPKEGRPPGQDRKRGNGEKKPAPPQAKA